MTANEHIKLVASIRARIIRLEDDHAVLKANLKLANTELDQALGSMSAYAEQLSFDLTRPAAETWPMNE